MKPIPSPILVRHPRRPPLGAVLAVTALLALLALSAGAAEDEAMPQKIAPPPDVVLQKNMPPSTAGVEKALPPATDAARKVMPSSTVPILSVERAGVSSWSTTPLPAAGELEAPLVLQLLQSGKLTVEQAWQQNQLNVAQVSLMLEKEVRQSGSLLINEDHPGSLQLDPLRRALAGLLVQHDARFAGLVAPGNLEPEQAKRQQRQLQEIPRRVRLWVGECLLAQNDRRGEEVLGSVVAEAKARIGFDQQLEAVLAGALISDFYRGNGDYAKSAALWLSLDKFSDDARLKFDLSIEAARDYTSMGDAKKAQQLYEQVPNDEGWISGLSLLDQARLMMSQGRQEEARRLLSQPIRGVDADQAQVFLEMFMGRSFYQSGDLQQARNHSRAAVERYNALLKPYTQYLEPLVKSAAELAESSEGWQREPIQVESREIVVAMQPGAAQSLIRRFTVRTFRDVPLAVSSDNAAVKARVLAGDEWSESAAKTATGESEKVVLIEISPQSLTPAMSGVVTITSPALASAETKVVVRVSAKPPGG